ncbi:hypothetical protein PtB15_15B444 [Puccinia triticina]|nr:hypothetical protein PtB15_15B444 [Puccinia triticina]
MSGQVEVKLKLTNLGLGTLWLGFSKAKPIIEDGHRLENLSWRLWQRELSSQPSHKTTTTTLIHAIIQPSPLTTRPASRTLQLPPRIISIAPTPPTASPAITAPTSPISLPSQLISPAHPQPHHLLLSPYPLQHAHDHDHEQEQHYFDQRPAMAQRLSSGSTTSSSLALKSIATSPSIQAAPENQPRKLPSATRHPNTLQRRATSTAGFKHKRRPPSAPRGHSSHQSTSRSASPRLTQPSKLPLASTTEQQQPQHAHHNANDYYSASPASSPEHSQDFAKPLQPSLPANPASQTTHQQQSKSPHDPDSQTTLSAGYSSSASLPSLLSPIIPETPNNSQVSAPFHVTTADQPGGIPDSLASSHTTARSSAFMPDAPPPTPSQNGAPLPTTMSVGLKNKAKLIQPPTLPPINTSSTAAPKKKAKFFIKEYEPDDDSNKPFSPTSFPPVTQIAQGFTRTTTPPSAELGSAEKQDKKTIQATVEEEEEGSDSDEWGSEYSDDETKENESRALEQELEKKRKQEEYHRQLFAKKHFVQRNRSHDGTEDQPAPIRRAGLSMLFHPELNHLQHHPTSSSSGGARQPGEPIGGPLRNQSAIELRRAGSSSSRKPPGDTEGQQHSRASIVGPIARPCSLIKSKSSVAVPVLAGQDPPVMIERSPSSISGHSSLRHRPPTRRNSAAPTAGPTTTTTTTTATQPPPRSLPHPAHQRHPSRLAGKPANVEYSDDSEDEESEEESESEEVEEGRVGKGGRAEQERRLARRTGTHTEPIALHPLAGISTQAARPEPLAQPLSPRTTRRNMLANEMTESVRRNLLWERQIQALALGVLPARLDPATHADPAPLPPAPSSSKTLPHCSRHAATSTTDTSSTATVVGPDAGPNPNTTSTNPATTTTTNPQFKKTHLASLTNNNKEYRNFSKGFHRTGW